MRNLLHKLTWKIRGVKVIALIGKSGTGKSFRARLVAEKHGVELIVDDGLLIRDQKILAGRSAKREQAYLAAVKTALFTDREHRRQVTTALEGQKFKRILVLGTSEGMINKICESLKLPPPAKTVKIEDIATAEEISTAMHSRQTQGKHVIPVPAIEVRRNYPRLMADSVKIFLRRRFGIINKQRVFEKTVVRPEFSQKGTVTIAESALTQMILHCVDEFDLEAEVKKITVKIDGDGYRLELHVAVPFGVALAGTVHNLQTYIVESIERFTGIHIAEMNVVIDTVAQMPRYKPRRIE
jgi:uncharacterized alkaline shock family protein YloU